MKLGDLFSITMSIFFSPIKWENGGNNSYLIEIVKEWNEIMHIKYWWLGRLVAQSVEQLPASEVMILESWD